MNREEALDFVARAGAAGEDGAGEAQGELALRVGGRTIRQRGRLRHGLRSPRLRGCGSAAEAGATDGGRGEGGFRKAKRRHSFRSRRLRGESRGANQEIGDAGRGGRHAGAGGAGEEVAAELGLLEVSDGARGFVEGAQKGKGEGEIAAAVGKGGGDFAQGGGDFEPQGEHGGEKRGLGGALGVFGHGRDQECGMGYFCGAEYIPIGYRVKIFFVFSSLYWGGEEKQRTSTDGHGPARTGVKERRRIAEGLQRHKGHKGRKGAKGRKGPKGRKGRAGEWLLSLRDLIGRAGFAVYRGGSR
jgi:hypothetical protein